MVRLPIVNSDDGTWGDIIRNFIMKEHLNDDNIATATNGGHKTITIAAGTTSANTAPIRFTSGALMTTPEVGAMEYNGTFHLTDASARRQVTTDTGTQTLTNKTIDANGTGNSITNLEVADFASGVIDTDLSSVSGSDDTLPSAKATKAALDGKRAAFMTGTIATAIGTAAKTVTLNSPWASHTPAAGDMYLFTYTNGTTAASATIAINGGSALAVRIANAAATAVPHTTAAGGVMLYYFDGTNLHLIGSQRNSDTDTNTTYVSTPTTFTSVTGTSQAAAVNVAYLADNAGLVTFTLPGTAAVGNVVVVSGLGAGGWRINAPAGDTIRVGATVSATGGYVASNNRYDSITLMCIVANADWVAVDYSGLVSVDGTVALSPTLIDEDSFATDTDRRAPTQQSTKAYIASQINTIPAMTMTLTNKTLSAPRVDIIDDINGMAILGLYETASAVNYLGIHNRTTTNEPYISANGADTDINIGLVPKGSGDVRIYKSTGEVRIYANGGDANVDLNLATKGTGIVKVENVQVATVSDAQTLTNKTLDGAKANYFLDANDNGIFNMVPVASAVNFIQISNQAAGSGPLLYPEGDDANIDLNLGSKNSGQVKINGEVVTTASNSQTLTNKTLTNPRINSIFDTNSNSILGLYGISSAVNQYYVTNQSAGNYPTIGVEGSDTNIGIVFAPKGAGPVRIYSPSGQTATIDVAGPDANIDIDLKPKGTGVVKIGGAPLLSAAGVATLTNKRINPRINSTTSSATPSINIDTTDQFNITALATAITSMTTNLSGTPVDGQKLMIRIKDDGTPRGITWGASFISSGVATLPTTTVATKTHLVGLIYDSAAAKWVCVAVDAAGY